MGATALVCPAHAYDDAPAPHASSPDAVIVDS